MSVLVSVTAYKVLPIDDVLPEGWQLVERPSDWGLSGWRQRRLHVATALRIAWASRRSSGIVICTSNTEVLVLAGLARLGIVRCPLIAYDLLTPTSRRGDPVINWVLGGVASIAAIRTRELVTLPGRFPATAGKVHFVPFPAREPADGSVDDGYFYTAGSAFRDWGLAFEAFAQVDARFVVASQGPFPVPAPSNVEVVGPLSPTDGLAYAARSRAVVMPFLDTELAHGPSIILDALRYGKPVVATRTAGAEDYVPSEAGILVSPGDAAALARALTELSTDQERARALGRGGKRRALELAPERIIERLGQVVDEALRA